MAEVVASHLVDADDALAGLISVTSAGTARWHVGSAMDPRARSALNRSGFTGEGSPAAFADATYLNAQDVVVAMSPGHVEDVRARLGSSSTEVVLLRDLFESTAGLEVADPFYGDDAEFDRCLQVITLGAQHLLAHLRELLAEPH